MAKKKDFSDILSRLTGFREKLETIREIFLANLVLIGEIPAPTFEEDDRVNFLIQRFSEAGLDNPSSDEVGNALGIYPGATNEKSILAVAHTDTLFSRTEDHTISVHADRMTGCGIGDNSLGLTTVVSLPRILETLDIELNSQLMLMGGSRSLGRGDLEGLRFFLSHLDHGHVQAGICLEGLQLGRLSISSLGVLRAEISCEVPEEYDWTRFGASGALVALNDVINKILAIPTPEKPCTNIVLGSIHGGTTYNRMAKKARLKFEVQSESEEMVEKISERIGIIVEEVSSQTRAEVRLDLVARRKSGGLPFDHPLIVHTRQIMQALEIEPHVEPSSSELSAFIAHDIPAITVGITTGANMILQEETIDIQPIFTGLAQVIGILLAIDGGYCDEH